MNKTLLNLIYSVLIGGIVIAIAPMLFDGLSTEIAAAIGIVIAIASFVMMTRLDKNKAFLNSKIGNISDMHRYEIEILSFIAMADNKLDDSEYQHIKKFIQGESGLVVTDDEITEIIKLVEKSYFSFSFYAKDIIKKLSEDDRKSLFKKAVKFATIDREIASGEISALADLVSEWYIDTHEMEKELTNTKGIFSKVRSEINTRNNPGI